MSVFIEAIADAVVRKIEHFLNTEQRLMTTKRAAKYVDMTESAVRQHSTMPCKKDGRRRRYDRKELNRWIDQLPPEECLR